MNNDIEYRKLLTDFIEQQIIVLGPAFAISRARLVPLIEVNDSGQVTRINGDPKEALKMLIDQSVFIFGEVIKKNIKKLLSQYSSLEEQGLALLEVSQGIF